MLTSITDNIDEFLAAFPASYRESITASGRSADTLLEIAADVGRQPLARFIGADLLLSPQPVSYEDIDFITSHIGHFGKDNRAGIASTLHRFSAIRNREGRVIGVTARVGRAVYGCIDILRDVVEEGRSILMLGCPGVGKTTILREISRVLADEMHKRVVIVDTSNEIAGDGDITHPGIGAARRLQVAEPAMQHAVMIEAVENHMPEVVVIDEIGTEQETYAARTIAERGVALVATAHGNKLENLLLNPTLSDLIGGIETVTLSDEEARRRKSRKAVLERRTLPTFEVIVELRDRDTFAIHRDVETEVDAILRGASVTPEIRVRQADGRVKIIKSQLRAPAKGGFSRVIPDGEHDRRDVSEIICESTPKEQSLDSYEPLLPAVKPAVTRRAVRRDTYLGDDNQYLPAPPPPGTEIKDGAKIFPYAVSRNRLQKALEQMSVPAVIARNWQEGDLVLTLHGQEKRASSAFERMRMQDIPIYTIRSNTTAQIQTFLEENFNVATVGQREQAKKEAERAIASIQKDGRPLNLLPQGPALRRMQCELARQAGLVARSFGVEPQRHVRISE